MLLPIITIHQASASGAPHKPQTQTPHPPVAPLRQLIMTSVKPDARPTQRTRFVCISDTHNCTVKLPRGDVLIHAGDMTNHGSYSELSKAVKWLQGLEYEAKIIIAGNHDITLDANFYTEHGHEFHNKKLASHQECLGLLENAPSLVYLKHEATTIRLTSPAGPRTRFTVFGSPYAPAFGRWAFYYPPVDTILDTAGTGTTLWDGIPPSADIVVTHGPPREHGDQGAGANRPGGCEALRRALWRVRPRLAVCGHIHEGRGVSRVAWDLDRLYGERKADTVQWEDPGAGSNNKMSLVDLTGRKDGKPLDNDGYWLDTEEDSNVSSAGQQERGPWKRSVLAPGWSGRRETCVVNAAILKSSFPHVGGKHFHKPIVVDLDLAISSG